MAFLQQNPIQEWFSYLIGSEPYRYHCWHRSVDQWLLQGRVYRTFGTINLAAGSFFLITSSLVLWAFRSHLLMKSSCYKIIFFLGIIGWFEVLTMSFWPAFILFRGYVFCNYPLAGMIVGRALTMEWVSGTTCCVVLAINRLADMTRKKFLLRIFDTTSKVFGILSFIIFYSLIFALFTDPCLYNSSQRGFSMDPFNEMKPELFQNHFLFVHNILFVSFLFLILIIFIFKFATEYENCWRGTSDLQRKILIQSTVQCLQYIIPCIVYLVIFVWNSCHFPKCFLEGTHVWFQISSGLSGIFCLFFNRPIRVKFLEKVGLKRYVVQPKKRNGAPSITRSIM